RDDLRTRYKIALESATGQEQGFAEYLAGRLYDPLSPTATILELELNRLWDLWHPSDPAEREALQDPAGVFQRELQTCRAQLDPLGREQGDAAICYSRKLFDMVKSDHALVRFVHEQLNEIDDPALTQGLAFDLLFEHTTELGTTRRRTMAELRNLYDERIADLNSVIEQFKRLHLLADAVEDGNPQAGVSGDMATRAQDTAAGKEDDAATVLAHDTLAVVVRNEYNLSLLSGPRARRVIENRVRGWSEDKGGDLLQGVELRVVDSGLADIRKLNDREQHFLKASRAARRKRRIRGSIAAACLATLVFAVLGVSLLHERETAAIEGLDTLSETNLASGNQLEAVLQATQAADDLSRWSLVRYGRNRSLRSAVASDLAIALDSTREVGRYRFNALAAQYPDCAAALDADGVPRLLSSGTRDGTLDGAALPPLRGTAALGMLSALFGIQRHSCDPASGIVVSAAPQGNIQLWKIGVTRAKQFPALRLVFPQMLLGVGVSPSAHLVAEWFRDSARQPSQIRIADLETGRLLASLQSGNVIRSVAFSQDSSMIGEAGSKGATVWTVADGQPVKTEFELWQAINIAFGNGKLGPLVAVVYSSSKFSGVEIEAPEVVELGTPLEVVLDYAQEEFSNYVPSPATAAAFSADGAMVAVGREDGKLDLWHVPGSSMFYGVVNAPDLAAALGPRGQPAEAVAFSPDGRFASLVTQAPAPIRVWWVNKAGLQAKSTDGLKKLLSAACERFRPYLDTPAGSRVDPAPDSQIDLRLLARACQSPEP
ncbi:MAG TPA: hypothetical protein VMD92_01940, partial [Acidobacteriaceae bacterium]|nr:hypothetical protein [Acidobacteriaceae bacterium]